MKTVTKAICLRVKCCGLVKLHSKYSSISAHNSDKNEGPPCEDMSNDVLKCAPHYNGLQNRDPIIGKCINIRKITVKPVGL